MIMIIWFKGLEAPTVFSMANERIIFTKDQVGFGKYLYSRNEISRFEARERLVEDVNQNASNQPHSHL